MPFQMGDLVIHSIARSVGIATLDHKKTILEYALQNVTISYV